MPIDILTAVTEFAVKGVMSVAKNAGQLTANYFEHKHKLKFQENEQNFQRELESRRQTFQRALAEENFQKNATLQLLLEKQREDFQQALAEKNFQRSATLQRELLSARFEFNRAMQQKLFAQQEADWERNQFVENVWPLIDTPTSYVKALEQYGMPMSVILAGAMEENNTTVTHQLSEFFNTNYGLKTGVYFYDQGWKEGMYNRTGNAQRTAIHRALNGLPTLILLPEVIDKKFTLNVAIWGWDSQELPQTAKLMEVNLPQLERQILRENALEWKDRRFPPNPYGRMKMIQQNLQTAVEEDEYRQQLVADGMSESEIEQYCSDAFADQYSSEGLEDTMREKMMGLLATHLQVSAALFVDAYLIGCSQVPKLPCLLKGMSSEIQAQYGPLMFTSFQNLTKNADDLNSPRLLTCIAQAYMNAGDVTTAEEFWKDALVLLTRIYADTQTPISIEHWDTVMKIRQLSVFSKEKYPYLLEQAVDELTFQKQQEERKRKRKEEEIRNRKAGTRLVKTVNGVEFAFRWCPAGTFIMGSPTSEQGRCDNETPHRVTLTKGFWIMETEVTQKQWKAVMGTSIQDQAKKMLTDNTQYKFSSGTKTIRELYGFKRDEAPDKVLCGVGDDYPMYYINWNECKEFCEKCQRLGMPVYLPTEAQWEYACRAGTTTALYNGEIVIKGQCNAPMLDSIAWYAGNSMQGFESKTCRNSSSWSETQYPGGPCGTHPVGKKEANAWGLRDMIGNVWEWCEDWYTKEYYGDDATDPVGPSNGSIRVGRGGSWGDDAQGCRSAGRSNDSPGSRGNGLGCRVVLRGQ